MEKKLIVIALAVSAVGLACAPRSNAGTEIVRDYGGAEVNRYAPPPPRPVYYPPPAVGVAVYPAVGFYPRPFFGVSSRRVVVVRRPFHRHVHHWH